MTAAETRAAPGRRLPSWARLADRDPFDVVAVLTLILILLRTSTNTDVEAVITALVVAALVFPALYRRAWFWLTTAAIQFAVVGWARLTADNHKYLIAYWCLAIGLALLTGNPMRTLATSARYLVGLAFLFAVIWKATSGDYLDGSFMYKTFLTDGRFEPFVRLFGDLSGSALSANRDAFSALYEVDAASNTALLTGSDSVRSLALVVSWWTIAIEALVAVAFLVPPASAVGRWRDMWLVLFIVSTYSVATVAGFGWLLAVMGYAQADVRRPWARPAYVVSFVLIALFTSTALDRFVNFLGVA